ncbi:MAG: succinylglutamate desuccinylase/aspartoacylase family protein [Chloroflexi bacterium]|nr:succinylglutamate desuccinylase/aspartoacylase family protein [Chloroflexota bacterium]
MGTQPAAAALILGGQAVEPGARRAIRLPVTTGLNGGEIAVWVHVVHGARPGPVLVLLGGLHGDEWFAVESLGRLVVETDPAGLRGTLMVIPFVNSPALGQGSRNMPDETDSPDLNRVFPGPLKATSDQIIAVLCREVLPHATHLLDSHIGPWGSAFQDVLVGADIADAQVAAESERLALAFGTTMIRSANVMTGFPGPRSSIGYGAGVLGIPALGLELGGAGFGREIEARWHQQNVDGVRAIMGAIDMIDDAPDPRPDRQLIYKTAFRVNPSCGGLLRPKLGPERLGTAVEKGTLLAEVISPYTLEVLEELRAPVDGLLFYVARDYPVNPGDWAYGVANTEDPAARWVTRA